MAQAKTIRSWEQLGARQITVTISPHTEDDDGPEFSSDPMPAAFSACLFFGVAVLIAVLLVAVFWR